MNIDIVNQHISEKLNIPLKDVKAINQFYWQSIRNHIYKYNPSPLNISNICVFYVAPRPLKKEIIRIIKNLRKIKASKRYRVVNSTKREDYLAYYNKALRGMLSVRKYYKFTN